jgi:formylglycine-generating enzyme required for sulfatase activity
LCTLKEWQRACYGPKRARYSYGSVFQQNRCNTTSVAGFPQEVGLSGSHRGCVSAIGTYDMVGNVGEWVAEGVAVGGDSTTPGKIASCAAKGRPPPGYAGPDLGFRCCFDLLE